MARWSRRGCSVVVRALEGAAIAALVGATVADCAGAAPCHFDSDCVLAYCSGGACVQDCVTDSNCPATYTCNQVGQCAAPVGDGGVPVDANPKPTDAAADSGVDAHEAGTLEVGTTDAGDAGGGADAPADTTTSDAPVDGLHAPDTGAPHTEFDLCAADTDCKAGLLCRAMYAGGSMRCTRSCTATTQCMTSTRCVAVGAEQYCVLADIGRVCTAAATCNFACLVAQQYCTMPCTSGSDCPNGYGCQAVGTPPQSVCVKAEVPCDATHTTGCIAAAACDTSATLVVAGCTLACSSAADCPQRAAGQAPWTCDGLCRRPGDVVGPVGQGAAAEYACNAGGTVLNMCNDAQHMDFAAFTVPAAPAVSCTATMTTTGQAGDDCVDSCLYQGGCAFGYACDAFGSIPAAPGARIGLCIPALGGGEIGASCATDADCFFGYCNSVAKTCSRDCTADGLCTTGSSCVASGTLPVQGLPFRRCQ